MLKKLLPVFSLLLALVATGPAWATGTPDALVRQISTDVLNLSLIHI